MKRLLRLTLLSRLLLALALLAMGGELAAPAFAATLRAGGGMPCHEQAMSKAAQAHEHHAGAPQPGRAGASEHLCCVLACLVVAPAPQAPVLAITSSLVPWTGTAARPIPGRAPPIPLPPPRSS